MKKATVLAVDDDQNIQLVIRHHLEDEGYKVLTAGSADELVEKLHAGMIDVILLDLVLPDGDGLQLMSKVREKTSAPIIVVSGKGDATDRIIGLELGADDYIAKPFELRELSARIKAVLRRMQMDTTAGASASTGQAAIDKCTKVKFDGWTLDRQQRQMFDADHQSAELTLGEFNLLEALVLAPHVALKREHLFELTRNGTFGVFDRGIDIQIGRIRKKLKQGREDTGEDLIKTIRGVGYKFCGEAEYL